MFRKDTPQLPYSALIDSSDRMLLALSVNVGAIVFLNESTRDTMCVHQANYYQPREPFPLSTAKPESYPEWTWNVSKRCFVPTRQELVTKKVRERSHLAVEKGRLIENIMRNISISRYALSTGVLFQESVYLTKKTQAVAFRNAGYPEEDLVEYPLVVQYADFAHLGLREAADDILFKGKLDDELLAKTELLRLKYFNAVKAATRVEELPPIQEDFTRENHLNSLL